MGQHWNDLRLFCVEPLLRGLDQGRLEKFELALVVYRTRSRFSQCWLESGGWTSDLSEFRQWLDAVPLTGGDSCESAMAEAVAEAVFLFSRPSELGEPASLQNQCVLLMAGEPTRLSIPWPFPADCKDGMASYVDLLAALANHKVELSVAIRYIKRVSLLALSTFMAAHKGVTAAQGQRSLLVPLTRTSLRWSRRDGRCGRGNQSDSSLSNLSTPTGVGTPPAYTPPLQTGVGQTLPLSPGGGSSIGAAAMPAQPAAAQPVTGQHATVQPGMTQQAAAPYTAAAPISSLTAGYMLGSGQVLRATASGSSAPPALASQARAYSPAQQAYPPQPFSPNGSASTAAYSPAAGGSRSGCVPPGQPTMPVPSPRKPMNADSPTGSQIATAIQGQQPIWQGFICIGAQLTKGAERTLYEVQAYAASNNVPAGFGANWPRKMVIEKLTPQHSLVKNCQPLLQTSIKVVFSIVDKASYGYYGDHITRDMMRISAMPVGAA
ncbi:hypothetical protein WJX72_004928 [[Myrmecia] bisecta]|uniref:Mediator of RNA polymerase II transcription subunit 25 n=1 Tax=[Myrmecia] bisecta TaxID=41462 RepID=A0AAW1Q759_9CHLO